MHISHGSACFTGNVIVEIVKHLLLMVTLVISSGCLTCDTLHIFLLTRGINLCPRNTVQCSATEKNQTTWSFPALMFW